MLESRDFHLAWSRQNRRRLTAAFPTLTARDLQAETEAQAFRAREEHALTEARRTYAVMAQQAPKDSEAFVRWFADLESHGPGQHDPLFPWLRDSANAEQMTWFLQQEVAGEAGFEDLVALTQVRMPNGPKLEMARNYWDEMGRGRESGMHGQLLRRLANDIEVSAEAPTEIVTESIALGNFMAAFALNRRYAYHSIGAMGAIELTAPGRSAHVYGGLKRLGLSAAGSQYYLLHSTLDVKHSEAWNREVLAPLVAQIPECAPYIAEGALIRLELGRRCFERYRRELVFNAQNVTALSAVS